jgi:hypothetical protein
LCEREAFAAVDLTRKANWSCGADFLDPLDGTSDKARKPVGGGAWTLRAMASQALRLV